MVIAEPISLIILTLATFSLVYSVAFLLSKRSPGFYFFIAGFCVTALTSAAAFFHLNKLADFFPQFFGFGAGLLLLIGPLTFLSVSAIVYPSRKLSLVVWLHLLPFIGYLLNFHDFWFLDTVAKSDYINRLYADGFWNTNELSMFTPRLEFVFIAGLALVYFCVSAVVLLLFIRSAGNDVKSKNNRLLFFLKSDIFLKISISTVAIFLFAFNVQEEYLKLLVSGVLLYLLVMFFLLMRSSDIVLGLRPVQTAKNQPSRLPDSGTVRQREFSRVQAPQEPSESAEDDFEPYTATDQSKQLFAKIESYMQTEKPYLDENFSRIGLAEKLQVAPRKITLTIHGETNFNFADYVNSYRIRHIEEQLSNGSEWRLYSVERLGKESGFNTRAAFNNALRRLRNLTPTELLKGED